MGNQEKSLCALQHKKAQKECDDQASTRASSPDPKGQSNSIRELPRFGVSKLEMLLQKLQDTYVGGPQAQGASQMSRSEIAQLVSEIIAEHNRTMLGWEIPVRPHVKVEEGAVAESNVVGVPNSQQEVSCQVAAASNGIGVENVSGQTWRTVAKNRGKCTLKTSDGIDSKFIKSGMASRPKTDPAMWPAVRSHEIEFILDSPLSVLPTHSVCSPSLAVGNFNFKILVFPRGTQRAAGKHLGAFVLAEPGDVEPDCIFKNVKFEITLVNWMDFTRSQVKSDKFSFKASGHEIDRGWHDLVAVDDITKSDSEWVGPTGSVCVRARCQVSSSGQRWSN